MGSYISKEDFKDLGYDVDELDELDGLTVIKLFLVSLTVFSSFYIYSNYF